MHGTHRGVALLVVIVITALVLVAVVGVSAYVSSEQTMVVSDNGFKASLSVAEAGITEAVTNLRRSVWHGSVNPEVPTGAYLTPDMVRTMATGATGAIAVHSAPAFRAFPDAASIFEVKLRKVSGPVWDGASIWINQVVRVGVYSLGERYVNGTRNANDLVGRRVLYSEYDVTYNLVPGTAPIMQSPFGYALLSGGMINLSGNATIIGASIRSNGVVDVGSHRHSVLFPGDTTEPYKYTVQTADGITSNGQGGQGSSKWVVVPPQDFVFGNIYMPYYLNQFNDFRSGTGFYSGAGDPLHPAIVYPNTNNAFLQALIQRDLGLPGTTATFGQIQTFCDNVLHSKNGYSVTTIPVLAIPALLSLQANLERATYYVQGPVTTTGGTMFGTIAVNGDLTLNGNADVSAGTGGIALLVHGNLVKGNGTATVIGSIYADGKITQMNGTFDVYGSVATQGAMDKVGGTFTVHFVPTLTDPEIVVGETPVGVTGQITQVIPLTGADGKWSERDYDAFQSPS
jgi:hypothetical protein